MAQGIDFEEKIPFKIKGDKTTWYLGLIPSDIFAKISSETEDISSAFKLLQLTLRGWDDFNVEFKTEKQEFFGEEFDVVPMDILRKIPFGFITQLGVKAVHVNKGLGEDEQKN